MNDDDKRIRLTFADLYRYARAVGTGKFSPFDLQRGLDDLRAWIDREVDIVPETEWDITSALAQGQLTELRGRHDLLEELVALARRPGEGPAVLAGTAGAGKTALAAALVKRVQDWDRQVWWVSAADPAGLSMGLARVARELGGSVTDLQSIDKGTADGPERLWRLLEDSPRRWLLVIDNADDPWVLATADSPAGIQSGLGWARASRQGLVVVTSRETDPRMWVGARLFTIGHLDTADAAQVLRDLAPEAGDDNEAVALARRLGGLPIALHLAGTYLRSEVSQMSTFAAYATAVRNLEGTMVARTTEISLAGLDHHGMPQAREVLQLASCYASTPIPTRILNKADLDEVLDSLKGVGLIQKNFAAINLHPLVTAIGRARSEGPEPWHTAIRHLAEALGELRFDLPEHWPQYQTFSQHLLALLDGAVEHVDQAHLAILADTAAGTARAFIRSGASWSADTLCRTALARCARLGEEHPAVLRIRHQLAWVIAFTRDPIEAEAIYRDVLAIRRRVLGDTHPDTLDSRHEFAWIATLLDRWEEAEQRYRDVLPDRLTYQGPDAPDTLTTRHELGYSIARQGRHDEARLIFENVLRDRRRVLGVAHPQTLQSQHALAWITARQGRWATAEDMYRRLLDARQVLEADHPHVLLTLHEIAWTLARQGRRTEAESLYLHVLERRSRILGDDHPETAETRFALSELRQGRIVDAVHPA